MDVLLHDPGLNSNNIHGNWLGIFRGAAWTRLCAAYIREAADTLRPFDRYILNGGAAAAAAAMWDDVMQRQGIMASWCDFCDTAGLFHWPSHQQAYTLQA